jgi:hypothetical protein
MRIEHISIGQNRSNARKASEVQVEAGFIRILLRVISDRFSALSASASAEGA